MDLNIKDVADLLNVSESTIRRLVADGKIPTYRLDRQYRFSRTEIEDWLLHHKIDRASTKEDTEPADEPPVKTTNKLHFSLYRAVYRGEVQKGMAGSSKEEIIQKTMEKMATRFDMDPTVLTELFLDREKMMPTTLGHGIGVPHTRDFLLNTHYDVIEIVYPEQPLDYGALDGEPVHTLFFLFACEDRNHLNLLAKLAHLNSNEKARAFFRTRPDKQKILEYIKNWESFLK